MKKKLLSFILTVTVIAAQFVFFTAYLPEAYAETIGGSCGDNVVWSIDSDAKILYIDGYGKMDDFSSLNPPWKDYDYFIDEVVVSEGITQIGKYSFVGLYVNKITLPSTIDIIQSSAFANIGGFTEFCVPENFRLREFEDFLSSITKTTWYKNLQEGPVYFGGLLCGYKGTMPENYCLEVEDGTYAINKKAFINQKNLVDIVIPDSVIHMGVDALKNTGWYNAQSDGPVYAGRILYEFRGNPQISDITFTAEEGTVSIAPKAFYNMPYITDVYLPSSIKSIGEQAFYMMGAFETVNFAEGCKLEYIGNEAFGYSQQFQDFNIEGIDTLFPESLSYVGDSAFRVSYRLKETVNIPAGLRYFGDNVFAGGAVVAYDVDENNKYYSDDEYNILYNKNKTVLMAAPVTFEIKEIVLPETVVKLCSYAFNKAGVYKVTLPDGIKDLGENTFKDSTIKEINLPYGIEVLREFVFASNHIKELVLPSSVTTIEDNACQWSQLQKIVIPKETVNIVGNPFKKANSSSPILTIYCYENSAAHNTAVEYGIDYVLLDKVTFGSITETLEKAESIDRGLYTEESLAVLDEAVNAVDLDLIGVTQTQINEWENIINNALDMLKYKPADYAEVNEAIEKANGIDRNFYTDESLANLDEAVAAVDKELDITNQTAVQEYADAITEALGNLRYKPADYTAVNEAIEKANGIDRNFYTDESLANLDEAVAAVDKELDITNQTAVQEYADAITEALGNLRYKPADYTAVNEAIEKANGIDRILYSQSTLAVLDQSINSVDYTLNITQQSIVDGFADRINSAISSLKYAEVILRNEPNGVIVSATAKEIYPTTALTVDMLDPSNHEAANFAVGGYIKSVQYYDINLIRDSVKVQPDGTVSVKIRIPDDVTPEKCRVYHVTDDPVDPLVRFASTLDGNYIVFETDHFSEFAVIEVETYLSGISITKTPSKLSYSLNEKLDLSDMQVTALFSDGKSEITTDYDVSSVDTSSIGTKTVTVYYTFGEVTKSASFEITVSADKLNANITLDGKDISEYNKKVTWYKGYSSESLQLECALPDSQNYNIVWSSDNSKVLVDGSGKVTNKGFFSPRKAVITATVTDSAGNVVATDSVTVRFYKFSFQLSGVQSVFTVLRKNGIFFF
ncbi:MAG: leucine-rich repeat protein [Acutalibacteraceae bacterium]